MVNKLTNNVKPLDEVDKINEIIDELENIDPLPSQTGKAGKFLQTDGTDASWESAPFRNIGEIISSAIPLTDAGLHLLDGALIQGGGIYSAFVTYIAGLVSTYPNLFVSESDWQTAVTTYGVCGKFVYDSTNNTVRIPKVTGKVDGTTDINALGDIVEAGLPIDWLAHTHSRGGMNITGTFSLVGGSGGNGTQTGVFYLNKTSTGYQHGPDGTNANPVIGFDASRNWTGSTSQPSYTNSARKNASTIHEQAVNMFFYIVLATSTKTDIEADIDQYITDFNAVQHSADDAVTTANSAKTQIDSWRSSLAEVKCVIETYSNGTSWYRVWSDKWCEQGGRINIASMQYGSTSVSLLKTFSNTNYTITIGGRNQTNNGNPCFAVGNSVTTNSFNIWMERTTGENHANQSYWQACGYIN